MGNSHGSLCSNVETRSQRSLQPTANPTDKKETTLASSENDKDDQFGSGEHSNEAILQTDLYPLLAIEESLRIVDSAETSLRHSGEPPKAHKAYQLMGTSCCLDYSFDEAIDPGTNQHAYDPDEKQNLRNGRNELQVHTGHENDYLDNISSCKISRVDSTLSGLQLSNCLKLTDDEIVDEDESGRSTETESFQVRPPVEDNLVDKLTSSNFQETADGSGVILRRQHNIVNEGIQLTGTLDSTTLNKLLIERKRRYSAPSANPVAHKYSILSGIGRSISVTELSNCPGSAHKLSNPFQDRNFQPPVKMQTVRLPGVSENRPTSQLSLTIKQASGGQISINVKDESQEPNTSEKSSHTADGEEPLQEVVASRAASEFVAGAGDDETINFPERCFVKEKTAMVVKEKCDCETSMLAFVDENLGCIENICLHLVDSTDSETQGAIPGKEEPAHTKALASGHAPSKVNPLEDTYAVTGRVKRNPLTCCDSEDSRNKHHQRSTSMATSAISVAEVYNARKESGNDKEICDCRLLRQSSSLMFDTEEQLALDENEEHCDASSLNTQGLSVFGDHLSGAVDVEKADVFAKLEGMCTQDSDTQEPENVDVACEGIITTPSLEDPCLLLYKLPLQDIPAGDKQLVDAGDATNDEDVTLCSLSSKLPNAREQMEVSQVEQSKVGTAKLIRTLEDKECSFDPILLQKVSSLVLGSAGQSENVSVGISNFLQVVQSADDFDALVEDAISKPVSVQDNEEADIANRRDLLTSYCNREPVVATQINESNSFPMDLDELLLGIGNECISTGLPCNEPSIARGLISPGEKYSINGL